MPEARRDRWDARYRDADAAQAQPAAVLADYAHLLPGSGSALELACGLGGNAQFLAARGLQVVAWDLSSVAIGALARRAADAGWSLEAAVRDVVSSPPPARSFDVIVVSRFLERTLCPALAAALRPGGLLFYQTFTREAVSGRGPADPAFRLGRNELLRLFPELEVVLYREEGRLGDPGVGLRDEAQLIARRAG